LFIHASPSVGYNDHFIDDLPADYKATIESLEKSPNLVQGLVLKVKYNSHLVCIFPCPTGFSSADFQSNNQLKTDSSMNQLFTRQNSSTHDYTIKLGEAYRARLA
jgi:hypothetical protein